MLNLARTICLIGVLILSACATPTAAPLPSPIPPTATALEPIPASLEPAAAEPSPTPPGPQAEQAIPGCQNGEEPLAAQEAPALPGSLVYTSSNYGRLFAMRGGSGGAINRPPGRLNRYAFSSGGWAVAYHTRPEEIAGSGRYPLALVSPEGQIRQAELDLSWMEAAAVDAGAAEEGLRGWALAWTGDRLVKVTAAYGEQPGGGAGGYVYGFYDPAAGAWWDVPRQFFSGYRPQQWIDLSPDLTRALYLDDQGRLVLWDVAQGQAIWTWAAGEGVTGNADGIGSNASSGSVGDSAASVSSASSGDASSGSAASVSSASSSDANSSDASSGDATTAAASGGTASASPASTPRTAWSADGRYALVDLTGQDALILSAADGAAQPLRELALADPQQRFVAAHYYWSPDGRQVAISGAVYPDGANPSAADSQPAAPLANRLYIYDAPLGEYVYRCTLSGAGARVTPGGPLAWSPDARFLIPVDAEDAAPFRLYDLTSGQVYHMGGAGQSAVGWVGQVINNWE